MSVFSPHGQGEAIDSAAAVRLRMASCLSVQRVGYAGCFPSDQLSLPCCSKDPLDRFLGASLLCTTGYMHWAPSHLAHHVKVRSRTPASITSPAYSRSMDAVAPKVPSGKLSSQTRKRLRLVMRALFPDASARLMALLSLCEPHAIGQHCFGPSRPCLTVP